MIIFRYLVKEVLTTVFATTFVLLLIFLSTQFVHYLSGAAGGRFTAEILLRIMLLQVPYLLGLLMPLGLFLAVLLAYGRLYVDREMIVLSSCGLSNGQLLGMTMAMAAVVTVVVAILTLWVAPQVAMKQRQLFAEAKATPLVETIMPGRFFSLENGKQVVYVEDVSRGHGKLTNIFVATKQDPNSNDNSKNKAPIWSVIAADSGYQINDPQQGGRILVINNGARYTGQPGEKDFRMEEFAKFSLLMKPQVPIFNESPDTMPSKTLWHLSKNNPENAAEFQWRLSLPLSVLLLTLLALPLSKVNPRQGKFAQLLPAILIYILYANMMFVSRSWIQSGILSPKIGFWWLHGLLLLLALTLIFWQSNLKIKMMRHTRQVTV